MDQLKDNWIIEKMCQHWGRLQNSGTVELTMGWQEALFEMLLFTALLNVYIKLFLMSTIGQGEALCV